MKKILIILGVLATGFFFIAHKKSKSQVPVHPVYLPEEDVQPQSQGSFNSQVSSIRELQGKLTQVHHNAPTNPPLPKAVAHNQRQIQAPTVAPVQRGRLPIAHRPPSRASVRKLYDPADLELLKRASARARDEGSRIAYIGEVQALYAFSPNFFEIDTDSNGQKALRIRQVHSYDPVRSPSGANKILVMREPYPVPSVQNYDLVGRAIVKAIEDGATVVNIAASQVDRNRLGEAIEYARAHGVPVITVPPPQN